MAAPTVFRVDLVLMVVGVTAVVIGISLLPDDGTAIASWVLIPLGLVSAVVGFVLYRRAPAQRHPHRDAPIGGDHVPFLPRHGELDGGGADGGGGGGD